MARAHPRSRGENSPTFHARVSHGGSSPLTRGKPHPGWPPRHRRGLIPAHAGKTLCTLGGIGSGWAHPRSRGENGSCIAASGAWRGSSPLTRGKHCDLRRIERVAGLIPAHAGKTLPRSRRSWSRRAHPRSRGENLVHDSRFHRCWGSSPLTRGKQGADAGGEGRAGLIPAHAGKTLSALIDGSGQKAHPRSRGENFLTALDAPELAGSSPLTRGKRLLMVHLLDLQRLIPTHAGKTAPLSLPWDPTGAHPHSRGENKDNAHEVQAHLGSSPLTRGKLGAR